MIKIPKFIKESKLIKREETKYMVFKVTPHTSNLNSTTRKFQNTLYELMSYKHPKYPWQRGSLTRVFKKDNLYISLKEKPKYWWVVRMYTNKIKGEKEEEDKIEQKIEFYIAIQEEFKTTFKTKFSNHEQWRKATIDEVENPFNNVDFEDTDLYALRYTRNDMFSLKFDYSQHNTPVRDIMTLSKDLNEGEEINLLIQTESIPRKKWKKLVEYSWDVWDRGRVPSRQGIDANMVTSDIANLGVMMFYELKSIIDDALDGVTKSFFNSKDEPREKKKPIFINSERESLLVNGDLSSQTKTKRNKPVFKTDILYTVKSKDEVKRDMLARSMVNSFSDLNGDNTLKNIKITINTRKEIDNVTNFNLDVLHSNLMSVEEIGKLQQLPTSELQKEFEDSLISNKRVETVLHEELTNEKGILAGTATLTGTTHKINIQTKNRDMTSTARAFIGSPRMGKDQAAINLVVESKMKHNMGAIILDVINEQNGHRGMADAIRDHLPAEEVIDLNLLDTEHPIYLGLEPIVKMIKDSRIASDRVAEELCAFLLTDGDEDKLRTVEHLREAAKLTNADILSIRHIFTSKKYRDKIVKQKKDIFDTTIWEQYDKLSEQQQQAIYTPVMRRIGQIMSSEFLKPIFCQVPNNNLDLYKLIDEGKVIIFRMKAGVMSQRVIEILTYWIILITFMIKLFQDGKSNNNGTLLVMNEPFQYMTDNLASLITDRILPEGPKKRLIPLIIFHHFKQFRKFSGFVDVLKSSSLNWHIFKNTNEDVYKELFSYLNRTFESPQQAFEATKMYQYIGLFLDSKGGYYDPFVADALPLVSKRYETKDNGYLTLEHSKKYGRPINEIIEEIKKRNREVMD